jgi:septum formation protein
LASGSQYRRELLKRLGIDFTVCVAVVDETRNDGEDPAEMVRRLAVEKARAVADRCAGALIIGADQVAVRNGIVMGKPGTLEAAREQLRNASGKRVDFLTGLCLLNTDSGVARSDVHRFGVEFRHLTPAQIDGYLTRERPFDCAGGFKSEGLGIGLFERLDGDDPTALVGLPLIRLVQFLAEEGVDVLAGVPRQAEPGKK